MRREITINNEAFRYVEKEIYAFRDTKRRYGELQDEIIHSVGERYEIRGGSLSDPTAKKATLLATDKILTRMGEMIDAIENAFGKFSHEQRVVLQYKYWTHPFCSWESVAMKYYVDRNTVYRWRRALVEEIAGQLGILHH